MSKYIVYADGASSNNQEAIRIGAYAAAIFKQVDGKAYKKDISGMVAGATNNQMELQAVIEALKSIALIEKNDNRDVTVRSDSLYVITGITEWLKDWKANGWRTKDKKPVKNKDLWLCMDALIPSFNLKVEKIEGNGSDKWNMYCDRMARKLCGSKPKR